jgi:hypothetical protein
VKRIKISQRERNRIAEHAPHGWRMTSKTTALRNAMVCMECPCGWIGWITEAALKREIDDVLQ